MVRVAPGREVVKGTPLCSVSDQRMHELSGLVALEGGYATLSDSNPDPSLVKVFFLGPDCRLTRSVGFPEPARDPEDLALAPDGALWVADVGDNANAKTHRTSVSVWRLPPGGSRLTGYQLTYPDGHHDAEAMLIDHDGLPVIVTKDVTGLSRIYKPTGQLATGGGMTALALVGRFSARITGTSNPFGLAGQLAVTGAAVSPDRGRVVLRTYADAYEFDVSGGDVVAALSTGSPRITPLPDETQGEGITYTRDGAAFVTVSDAAVAVPLLRYQRQAAEPTSAPGSPAAGSPGAAAGGTGSPGTTASRAGAALARLVSGGSRNLVATGLVAAGVLMVIGLMLARRRTRTG